jgi:hypothetical protein
MWSSDPVFFYDKKERVSNIEPLTSHVEERA